MRLLSLFAAFFLTMLVLVAAQPAFTEPTVFAIRFAKVVSAPGEVMEKATIVIRSGRIEALGFDVTPPADATLMDGTGLVIYPGFIDAGNSWGIDLGLRRNEMGAPEPFDFSTSALAATKADNRKGITPEFQVATALKSDEETLEGWRKAGITARLAFPEGGLFAGQAALVAHSRNAPRLAVLDPRCGQVLAFKVPPGPGYPSTLMGIISHARQTLLDVDYHRRRKSVAGTGGDRVPVDPALDSLEPLLAGQSRILFEADTRDEIHRALAFCKEFGLRPIILGGAEAWKVAAELKEAQVPVIVRLSFPDKPRIGAARGRRAGPRPQPTTPIPGVPPAAQINPFEPPESDEPGEVKPPVRALAEYERKHEEELKNAGVLAKAGVRLAFCGQGVSADKFLEQLRKAIKHGLPAEAAEQALTSGAASILGQEQVLGRLAEGRPANLTVLTGPVADEKSQVRWLFVDGQRFECETKLAKKEAANETPKDPAKGEDKAAAADEGKKPATAGAGPDLPTEIDADRRPSLRTGGNVLVKNGTLLTVSNGTVVGDLLVKGGKIAQLGQNLTAPTGTAIIDGQGLFFMPGIIDTHSHFAMAGGVNEFTLSVVPEVRVRDIVNSEDVQIYRGLAGGVTTARLLHGSANCIGGQDAVIKLKYGQAAHELIVHDAARGVKFALGENVKRSQGRFPNTRLGVEAVLVRAFTEAQAYRQAWREFEAAKKAGKPAPEPRRDLRLEALVDILDGKLLVHCHSYRADEILMLLRVADSFGFKVKSLQHGLEGYKVAPEIAEHGASLSSFADWWAYKIEAFDAIPHNAALLTEAGVVTCLKSDSNELMRHLYQEAAKTLKYGGMDENAALRLITLNAAKQLSLEHRLGSLEVGKDADLAAFTAHPLSGYARCVLTLIEGEVYFDDRKTAANQQLSEFQLPKPRGPGVPMANLPRDAKGTYLLRGVTLHPVDGAAMPNCMLLVADGRIKEMGPAVTQPPGATIIDLTGLHLYPGMIDAGTILGLTEIGSAPETQDFAEGGDFQPDLRASIGINPDSELIPVTRANGVLTVVSRPTGAVVSGQSALINLLGWVPKDMILADPVALHVDYPARLAPLFGTPNGPPMGRSLAKKQREEKLRRLRQLFEQAKLQESARINGMNSRPLDPRLAAMLPYVRGEKPVIIEAQRQEEITQALKFAQDLELKMILSGGLEAWKVAGELKKHDVPVILGPVMTMPQEPHDRFDAPFTAALKLHEAGVKYCIRSEGGTNSRNLPYEAAMAVSYGLPQEEGLKAVTLYPAEILGVADKLGTLTEGKLANLVITDGDLLQPSTNVLGLFIAGQPVEPTSKQTKLYERYRQRLREVRSATK